jgi:glutamine amidotransferase-like uncharacterized protein
MRPRIALFVHQPRASVQSNNGIMQALSGLYDFKIFTRHEVEQDFFDDVDAVCFPGGVGDSDAFDWLMQAHKQRIKNFVDSGGHYLGICMGAYWADRDYFDLLDTTRVQQYIRSPGTCTRRPHAKHMPITWNGQDERMYFYDGACMVGGDVDCVASYSNGDPMAIIQGRVGLIGCHPEAVHSWYQEHSWMQKEWNGTKHHLLLDFVNQLIKK